MHLICAHCGGTHASLECPVFPQMCNNCYEEHPYGIPCYQPFPEFVSVEEEVERREVKQVDAEILVKVEGDVIRAHTRNQRAGERVKRWREANRQRYNDYMREYMRR